MEVEFYPNRGKHEPVDVYDICKVVFDEGNSAMVVVQRYTYHESYVNDMGMEATRLQPIYQDVYVPVGKAGDPGVFIERNHAYHVKDDKLDDPHPIVLLHVGIQQFWLYCKDEKQQVNLFDTIMSFIQRHRR